MKVLKNPEKSPRSNPSFHDPVRRLGDHVWSDLRSYSHALIPLPADPLDRFEFATSVNGERYSTTVRCSLSWTRWRTLCGSMSRWRKAPERAVRRARLACHCVKASTRAEAIVSDASMMRRNSTSQVGECHRSWHSIAHGTVSLMAQYRSWHSIAHGTVKSQTQRVRRDCSHRCDRSKPVSRLSRSHKRHRWGKDCPESATVEAQHSQCSRARHRLRRAVCRAARGSPISQVRLDSFSGLQ